MLRIAVAIILSGDDVIVAKRPSNKHQGGKWEFPGGKVEAGESAAKALVRECHEELGITVKSAALVDEFDYAYDDLSLKFTVFIVDTFEGEARGMEGQSVQRIHWTQLSSLVFPSANQRMISLVENFYKSKEPV